VSLAGVARLGSTVVQVFELDGWDAPEFVEQAAVLDGMEERALRSPGVRA
jgi:hypothetical protein